MCFVKDGAIRRPAFRRDSAPHGLKSPAGNGCYGGRPGPERRAVTERRPEAPGECGRRGTVRLRARGTEGPGGMSDDRPERDEASTLEDELEEAAELLAQQE